MNDLVLVEIALPIATITLNRAERHNSLIPELLRELLGAIEMIKANENVRAVVLRANGKSFSTGGDVKAFYDHWDEIESYSREIVGLLNETIIALINLPQPIVAAVHGIVTGGSLGLVLACDVVLVSERGTFTPYYSVVGFSPDGGWTAMLPNVIGQKRAAQALMLNETITARQAVEWGMANRIVEADSIRDEAVTAAQQIAAMKVGSIRRAKKNLWSNRDRIVQALESERAEFITQIKTEEAKLGMAQFLSASMM
jgi:2-(1,2-epoxy-1,2-dihydrophenyl)acetyl-CoA isomerase